MENFNKAKKIIDEMSVGEKKKTYAYLSRWQRKRLQEQVDDGIVELTEEEKERAHTSKLEAIKMLRERANCSLMVGKNSVFAYLREKEKEE